MRSLRSIAAFLLASSLAGLASAAVSQSEVARADAEPAAPLEVARGEGFLPLLIPRKETLTYGAHLELGPVRSRVGTVTLRSGVEAQRKSLLRPKSGESGEEVSWIEARAVGGYTVYSMDSVLETRFLQKDWPSLVNRMEQKGTERRRREVLVGTRAGERIATYRSDTTDGAPIGTRIWRDPVELSMPEGALDSIGAVYLVRTMMRDGIDSVSFPMFDKDHLWKVEIALGEAREIEVPAGRFLARPVSLNTERVVREGATIDPDDDEQFSGPFGIRGSIHLWVQADSGVPVLIAGTLPAGPLTIDLEIKLESAVGTPLEFQALHAGDRAERP